MQKKPWWRRFFFSIRDDVAAAGWGRGGASSVEERWPTCEGWITHTNNHAIRFYLRLGCKWGNKVQCLCTNTRCSDQSSNKLQLSDSRRHWERKWSRKQFSWDRETFSYPITTSKYCTPLKPLKEQSPLKINIYTSSPLLHAERNSGEVSSSTKTFLEKIKVKKKKKKDDEGERRKEEEDQNKDEVEEKQGKEWWRWRRWWFLDAIKD